MTRESSARKAGTRKMISSLCVVPGVVRVSDSYLIQFETPGPALTVFGDDGSTPEICLLRSPSGTGKTTFLRSLHSSLRGIQLPAPALSFRLRPDPPAPGYAAVGFVPQDPPRLAHWPVSRLLPSDAECAKLFFEPDELVGLGAKRLGQFSGGQRKRIYTSSVLEHLRRTPAGIAFLLLDETLDGLGSEHAVDCLQRVCSCWQELSQTPLRVVLVTHLDDGPSSVFSTLQPAPRRLGLTLLDDISGRLRVFLEERHAG